jgi:L-threonylcarbamoyladenylate synthase
MSERYDCSDPEQREAGIAAAVTAVQKGELVVLPTDTVYGVGADAFTPWAVSRLLAAKGRGRNMPPPVLVGTMRAANALVEEMGPFGQDLVDQFWPGGLTLVCRSTPTLAWDLGETRGTVAVRMPLHAVALDLLKKTGPLAVSSANVSGQPPATTADEAMAQLGDSVSVYLDGGPCAGDVPSTIVDLTGSVPRLLRRGVIPVERLQDVVPLALMDNVDSDDVPEDVGDVVPEEAAVEAEAPGPQAPGPQAPGPEAPEGHAPADGIPEDAPEAAPEGPAGLVAEDTGRPREVFHNPLDLTDQGKPASPGAAE